MPNAWSENTPDPPSQIGSIPAEHKTLSWNRIRPASLPLIPKDGSWYDPNAPHFCLWPLSLNPPSLFGHCHFGGPSTNLEKNFPWKSRDQSCEANVMRQTSHSCGEKPWSQMERRDWQSRQTDTIWEAPLVGNREADVGLNSMPPLWH